MNEKPVFEADHDWLTFHSSPSRPRFQLPKGAVDAHCHVFGPGEKFPYAEQRKYTPTDAPAEALWALRDHLGFSRSVIVQATCHGNDNRALCDALRKSNGLAKGVASVATTISDSELITLRESGVCGVRFNFVRRLVDPKPLIEYEALAQRLDPLGLHVVIYFEAGDLREYAEFFSSLPVPIVVDHMGRPDVTKNPNGEEFRQFVRFMSENENVWCKVTCPERLSRVGPPAYGDVVPFAKSIVERFPNRVLWGTDWPHPNMKTHMPDDGHLVDFIPSIAPTVESQQRLLVHNPMRLYWPEEQ
ncbi:MAG: amidohydrolase family protein [Pseudomonadota bacterium]